MPRQSVTNQFFADSNFSIYAVCAAWKILNISWGGDVAAWITPSRRFLLACTLLASSSRRERVSEYSVEVLQWPCLFSRAGKVRLQLKSKKSMNPGTELTYDLLHRAEKRFPAVGERDRPEAGVIQ